MSLEPLFRELDKCENLGGPHIDNCKNAVRNRWIADLFGPIVYPWKNLGWDYRQYVKNNYDPRLLGIDRSGSFTGLMKNIDILMKQFESLILVPNPPEDAKAGITDAPLRTGPNPALFANLQNQVDQLKKNPSPDNIVRLQALQSTLEYLLASRKPDAGDYAIAVNSRKEDPPYSDPFFEKPIDGKGASSYFVQTGFCQTKQKNKEDCLSKGYQWIGDKCYKKKYLYLDNSPGLKVGYVQNMNGLIPSMINTATQLNPNAFIGILQGYGVPGVDIQQCLDEHFIGTCSKKWVGNLTWFIVGLMILLVMFWR